jgi:hypothetical protein
VKKECRITGGNVEVPARVATHCIMPAAVHTERTGAGDALHDHLEVPDVIVLENQVNDRTYVGKRADDLCGEVTLKAAGVIVQGVARRYYRASRERKIGRTQVDGVINKRTAGDTSSTCASREIDRRRVAKFDDKVRLLGDISPVAGQGCVAAIKDRIFL